MTLDHIHHVAIIVSDYEKAKDFYVNQLELEVIRENYRAKRDDWKLDLRLGDCELEIFGVKNPPARVNRPEALRTPSSGLCRCGYGGGSCMAAQ